MSSLRQAELEGNHHLSMARDQLLHVAYATGIALFIATAGVGLDLGAQWVKTLGVSDTTHHALELLAHGLLYVDLSLFGVYVLRTGIDLIRTLIKP